MPSTANFGWPTPEDTAQVANGPAIIRALGDAADATVFAQGTAIAAQGTAIADLDAKNIPDFTDDVPSNGQALVFDSGVGKYAPQDIVTSGFQFAGTRYYTSSGSFAKADPLGTGDIGLRAIRVRMVGGGGGGGGANSTSSGQVSVGGGGAGGMYAESFITNISGLDNSISVDVGAGGSGNVAAAGDDGGTSSFGTLVSAEGGGPGLASVVFTGAGLGPAGNPERSATGDLVIFGSSGSFGLGVGDTPGRVRGGIGGASHLGGGGTVFSANNGRSGGLFGGGGSGGRSISGDGAGTGGNGATGVVIVEVFV